MTSLSEQEDTVQLVEDVTQGTIVFDSLIEKFTTEFKFHNKTLDEWSEEMFLEIPQKPDLEEIQGLLLRVALLIQKSSHYLSISSAINTSLTSITDLKKADIIETIVKDFEDKNIKRPAKDIIENMAISLMRESFTAELVSKIIKDFWHKKLDSFIDIRKTLESTLLASSLRLKYE